MVAELKKLSPTDGQDVYDMLQAMPREENGFTNGVSGKTFDEFKAWLVKSDDISRGVGLEDWMVRQDTYWLYVDGVPVGMSKLRHSLTEKLREEGGHIGYAIRPAQRGKGYGKLQLQLLIEKAAALGIDQALVTVQNHNLASIGVAKSCGGMLEKANGERLYFWIETNQTRTT